MRFDHTYAGSLTESDLDHQAHSLERLIAAGKGIGHPHDHPLQVVHKTEYSQRLKFELETIIRSYRESLEIFRKDMLGFVESMEIKAPVTEDEWRDICNYARSVIAIERIPAFLRRSGSVEREFAAPETYLSMRQAFEAKKAGFLANWNENFLRMEMDTYREKYEQANKKFFGKGKALAALTSEMQAFASFTVETDRILVYLTDISFYQKEAEEIAEAEAALSYEWKEILKDHPTGEALQAYKDHVKGQLQIISHFSDQIQILENEGALKGCIRKAENLITSLESVKAAETQAAELLELTFENTEENWMDSRLKLCAGILENASSIKDWIVYRQFAAECRQRGLGPICDAYEAGIPHDEVMTVYLRSIYRTIILSVIEKEPVLNGFTGIGFNEKIAQFKKLDQEFMELTKDEMFYKLTHQLPTSYESVDISRELNILRRAISSNGRGISIRTLFEQIPHILTRLCPCMLMSPISAAQYLKAQNDLFDIVIFDEASQLPTCKAVGVLARGKNAVIVGDPNQMPPTSFFAGNTVDEDNLDIEDLDSILDDCLALGMPSAYLHWHYRSRHESLIAFSNQEFYENSMLTFPSVNDREKRVNLVKADGFFDRGKGRVNEGEAKAIVAEIKRRYQSTELTNQTIGVVTFNISQQTLIEDLLQEEYQKDAAFDRWANVGEETLFVKNLENVQGDERDVILFSIAFGPDADGKLSLNFGPLNKDGGWKRLNVAVSRARLEMVVFTVMTADMIDLRRTKSKGVEALKDFLEFAQKGRLQGEYVETRVRRDQGIMEHICQVISDGGYRYQKAVGHSKFKIDIAVANPYNEEEYLLGIMLDGESYRQSSNTKDREVAQSSVLNGLGWELHRIWTMDWWDNRDKELSKLMQVLEEKREKAYQTFLEAQSVCAAEAAAGEKETVEVFADESEAAVKQDETAEDLSGKVTGNVEAAVENEGNVSEQTKAGPEMDEKSEPKFAIDIENRFAPKNRIAEEFDKKVAAGKQNTSAVVKQVLQGVLEYRVEDYVYASEEGIDLTAADYNKKENLEQITAKIQQILDAEAPIAYDRLMKKTLRAFNIARSSPQTLETTDKALKKALTKLNKQAGVRFYWRKDQEPDMYRVYRMDIVSAEKRTVDEICQQELKNAVCFTLQEKGALNKDILMKETIRTMGYARSGTALIAAVERGLKYGRKTGEIGQDTEKRFVLNTDK